MYSRFISQINEDGRDSLDIFFLLMLLPHLHMNNRVRGVMHGNGVFMCLSVSYRISEV